MRKALLSIVALSLLALAVASQGVAYASHIPDTIQALRADAYKDVIETGDVLFVAMYDIKYSNCDTSTTTGCPLDTITETFLGNLIDDNGATTCALGTAKLRTVSPITSIPAGFNGYNQGVFSIYMTASEVSSGTPNEVRIDQACHSLEIQANPAHFAAFVADQINVTWRAGTETVITIAIRERATQLSNNWGLDLISNVGSRLNDAGRLYFEKAIPNLRTIAPDLFADDVVAPEPNLSDFTNQTTYADGLVGFWDGTDFGNKSVAQFDALEAEYGVSAAALKLALAIGVTIIAVLAVLQSTGDARIGMLAMPIALPIMVLMGFGTLTIVAIMALMSGLALSYLYFLKGA